jgi:hypothetical protein
MEAAATGTEASPAPVSARAPNLFWWERRWGVPLILLLAAVPLLWPAIPPLGDLPGHMGRYRVELDLATAPGLRRFYAFHWHLVGNLGVDLLVIPLARFVGLELAVKLIVIAIPVMTVGGFLWVAHEVHGRIPATSIFALPLAYNYPFEFGFANFALSMALAFLAFGLWLRLGRTKRWRLRAAAFVPLSLLVWTAHVYGWAVLAVLASVLEFVAQIESGRKAVAAGVRSAGRCLPLAAPLLAMVAWRSGHSGLNAEDWFDWPQKLKYLAFALRDRWMVFDLLSLAVLLVPIGLAWRGRALRFAGGLGFAALALFALFAVLPRIVFGSSYADMRLVPYALAVALLAIRPRPRADARFLARMALAASAFLFVRIAGNTASLWLYDRSYRAELAALDRLPDGARLVSFVGRSCAIRWWTSRLEHLPGLALERKRALSNDQWDRADAQPLAVTYAPAGAFARDPSQIVVPDGCAKPGYRTIGQSLRGFPRQAFDYLWLIQPPPYRAADAWGLQPVWRSGGSVLYRVVDRRQPR